MCGPSHKLKNYNQSTESTEMGCYFDKTTLRFKLQFKNSFKHWKNKLKINFNWKYLKNYFDAKSITDNRSRST